MDDDDLDFETPTQTGGTGWIVWLVAGIALLFVFSWSARPTPGDPRPESPFDLATIEPVPPRPIDEAGLRVVLDKARSCRPEDQIGFAWKQHVLDRPISKDDPRYARATEVARVAEACRVALIEEMEATYREAIPAAAAAFRKARIEQMEDAFLRSGLDVTARISGTHADKVSFEHWGWNRVTVHQITDGGSGRRGSYLGDLQDIGFRTVIFKRPDGWRQWYNLEPEPVDIDLTDFRETLQAVRLEQRFDLTIGPSPEPRPAPLGLPGGSGVADSESWTWHEEETMKVAMFESAEASPIRVGPTTPAGKLWVGCIDGHAAVALDFGGRRESTSTDYRIGPAGGELTHVPRQNFRNLAMRANDWLAGVPNVESFVALAQSTDRVEIRYTDAWDRPASLTFMLRDIDGAVAAASGHCGGWPQGRRTSG